MRLLSILMLVTSLLIAVVPFSVNAGSQSQFIILLPININTADELTLSRALAGVGPSKAAAIVAYRREHGPFLAPDDLMKVKGVGPGTMKKNHGRISIK